MKLHQNPDWLEEKYWGEGLSIRQVASLAGVNEATILAWMKRYGIARRSKSAAQRGERNPFWNRGDKLKGKKNPHWKGGRRLDRDGYVQIYMPDHPRSHANGYVYEHILVLEEKLGRPLLPNETSHHINGIKDDNRKENLLALPSLAEHTALHNTMRDNEQRC